MNPIFLKVAIFIQIAFFVFFLNVYPLRVSRIQPLQKMNDVPSILVGYSHTPNLLKDGLRWWHGPWIEDGIQAYRPISSYLLWSESYLVQKNGFVPIIIIGALLVLILGSLSALIAYQLTESYWCSALAGTLAAYVIQFDFGGISKEWIAWYPVHHDLMAIAFALAAVWTFLKWLKSGRKCHIIWCWVFFILGIFCKEYLYIFPVMAFAIAMLYKSTFVRVKDAVIQSGIMFCTVLAFYIFRQSILPHPYMPKSINAHMLISHPLLFWFHSFYMYLPAGIFWLPALALVIFSTLLICTKMRNLWITVLCIVGTLIFVSFTNGIINTFWYLFDWPSSSTSLSNLIQMLFTFYTFWLVFKYRKTHNGALAFVLMMLSYIPTFAYLGWHYSLSGWFFRSAVFWPVITKLAWDDISPLFPSMQLWGASLRRYFIRDKSTFTLPV